ncbi:hypothetical protein Tco_0101368 [Tanacetum coccineum]
MLIVMKRVRLNMSMMKEPLLWHPRVPRMKALKVAVEWVILARMKKWKEIYDEHPYDDDDFDDCGLINAQMAFANIFVVNLDSPDFEADM